MELMPLLLGNGHYDLLLDALVKQNCPLAGQACCTVNYRWDILSSRLQFSDLKPNEKYIHAHAVVKAGFAQGI